MHTVNREPQHPNAGFNPRAVHSQERTSAPGIHNFELLINGLIATTRTAHFGFREKLKITIPDVQRNYNLGRRLQIHQGDDEPREPLWETWEACECTSPAPACTYMISVPDALCVMHVLGYVGWLVNAC